MGNLRWFVTQSGPPSERAVPAAIVIALVFAGCGAGTMRLPRLAAVDPATGYKMLRPQATAMECRTRALWRDEEAEDLLERAALRLLASDAEADAIVNARLEWTSWGVGVYGKCCVTLTGDVVRSVRTVLLPMSNHDDAHSGHGRQ